MKNGKIGINLIASIVAFIVSLAINFFLAPYIINHVGVEAYGFVALANNFVMYISIVTIALNSMSGRFIAIAIHQGDKEGAREYYSSTFFANVICIILLIIILVFIILKIEFFITISDCLLLDVKCLLFCILASFLLEFFAANFSVSYLVKNKLYISSVLQIKGNFIKVLALFLLFYFFNPHIAYLGIATLAMSIYIRAYDYYYKNQMIPYIFFKKKYVKLYRLKEVVISGIWNMVIRIGNVLAGGLDLLIANLYIGSVEMGILALAKVAPNIINSVVGTIANIFMPTFLELYARQEFDVLVDYIKKSMRILSLLLSLPIVIFLSFGDVFFKLWVPTQDANVLYFMAVISILPIMIIGPVAIMHNIFTLVNKIKVNALLIVFTGVINTFFVLLLLKYTTFGLIAVVAVSSILSLIRNICYTVPFGAVYLKRKWYMFFSIIFRSGFSILLVSVIGIFLKNSLFAINDWWSLLLSSIFLVIINVIVQSLFVLTKEDRLLLQKKLYKN